MNIWRLNVKSTQIEECIREEKFALPSRPRNPEIQKDDLLLLQLVATDAKRLGKTDSRIEFALVFDHYEEDHDGIISKHYWPNAGKTWHWILNCSGIIPTVPFSLENLNLIYDYKGETNPRFIRPEDTIKIIPYILRYNKTNEIGKKVHTILKEPSAVREYTLWSLIRNNDRIVEVHPDKVGWDIIPQRKEIKRNPELPCLLKELYGFKCQICEHDFKKDYGVPYSETHHMVWLSRGGVDHSNNLIVVCPNHHRIIHETKPNFDRRALAFAYPNGFHESLRLTAHLKDLTLMETKLMQWHQLRAEQIQKEKLNRINRDTSPRA